MSSLLWSCIWNWYIQSLIILLCVQFWCCVIKIALVIQPPSSGITTWRVSAYWLDCQYFFNASCWPIKQHSISKYQPQWKWSTTTGSLWLNTSKSLWNVLMCPFVLHAVNSIVVSHWHMQIIGSSQLTDLLTPLNLSLSNLKMQNLFSDTWFPILQFMLDLELTSLNVRLSAPNFAQRLRDSVLKPAHTIGSCRSSPEVRCQRSPWFSRPAIMIVASPESHILSDSARFKDLIIRRLAYISCRSAAAAPRLS